MDQAEVLLIGGRAGVGKTTVGWEVSALLRAAAVSHAVIDGDFMGQVHPAPEGDPDRSEVTESNLTAVWANFARRGYRRLIYTNTLSVLPETTGMFERAMGAGVRIVRVLLTASDATARERLVRRELGSELEREIAGSARKARLLDQRAPAETVRVVTDGRAVVDIAREVVAVTGWAGPTGRGGTPVGDRSTQELDKTIRNAAVVRRYSDGCS
ncbi:AAA family ATPase [Streptomyces sparsogenes]